MEQTTAQLQSAINKIEARLARLETGDIDLRGRRARNASDAELAQDYVTLAQLNSLPLSLNPISPEFICTLAGHSASQTIPLTTYTALQFDTNIFGDKQKIHSTSTNNTRFTFNKTGYYLNFCQSTYIGAVGLTLISLVQSINGAIPAYPSTDTTACTSIANPTNLVLSINFFNPGDYLEFYTYHNGPGSEYTAAASSFAGVLKVG